MARSLNLNRPNLLYGGDPSYSLPTTVDQNQQHFPQPANDVDNTPGPDRTQYGTLAPPGMESRVMQADRVHDVLPMASLAVSYAEQDAQKGGAPGSPGSAPGGNDPQAHTNFITSQSPDGITSPGAVPSSAVKRAYGASDWSNQYPTFLPAHLKIGIFQNPNAAQTNTGIWASEGQMANTKYSSPAPWAAGSYIG